MPTRLPFTTSNSCCRSFRGSSLSVKRSGLRANCTMELCFDGTCRPAHHHCAPPASASQCPAHHRPEQPAPPPVSPRPRAAPHRSPRSPVSPTQVDRIGSAAPVADPLTPDTPPPHPSPADSWMEETAGDVTAIGEYTDDPEVMQKMEEQVGTNTTVSFRTKTTELNAGGRAPPHLPLTASHAPCTGSPLTDRYRRTWRVRTRGEPSSRPTPRPRRPTRSRP